ncbi:hypothetical protein [Flavobacterium urocaniciphilum]|uniref:Antibiotic biosynthesis monooxygenase n=1 Tax=Flavobacterium urocaniciphilum TaxID=1299341 RepID=A0A1H8YUY9_9FLAO|nr:hypothetical protein [Flavobacterium urocaniciphilum]SEP55188.1 hypothetical protein SAMN05444005_101149 [Flavobacterium urocaniciphilum]
MINVIVSYKVKPEFVAENKLNIENFLSSFKEMDTSKFNYSVFVDNDGVTFTHVSNYQDENIQKEVLNNLIFLEFQKKRDESGLNNSHKVQILEYIGSTNNIL